MTFKTNIDIGPLIVPVNDETHAMLDYAKSSSEAQSIIEQARQEIRNGEGIEPTADYFDELNRRVSQRAREEGPNKEA